MNRIESGFNSDNIILDSIADGVFTVDLDYRITSVNKAAQSILHISQDEALGKYCFEVFHANICEHSCALRETFTSGKNIVNKTIYIVNAEGEKIPVSISTALLRNTDSTIIGGVETFRNISDIIELRKTIESKYTFEDIVSKSSQMMDLFGTRMILFPLAAVAFLVALFMMTRVEGGEAKAEEAAA